MVFQESNNNHCHCGWW